jgi:hypothetical protein
MQKLNHRPGKGDRGSILVGVISFSILLALAGTSFIQICSSMQNQEIQTQKNAQAFHAAESAVMMAANWLRNRTYFPMSGTFTPFSTISLNGVWVDVAIVANSNSDGAVTIIIEASAFNDPTSRGTENFIKRIHCTVMQDDFGRYNMFVNRLADPNWAGYGGGKVFHGRFHWNDPTLRLALKNNANNPANQVGVGVTFLGDVTCANTIQSTSGGTDINLTGGSGSNYSKGLKFRDANVDAAYADQVFKSSFSSTTEVIAIPAEITSFASGVFGTNDVVGLPISALDEGTGNAHYRPTLTFSNDGSAEYSYYSSGSVVSFPIASVNNKILFCRNNLNVKGVVQGNTSVVTERLKSIAVVGDLVYTDNDIVTGQNAGESNNHVPIASTNCLALVSGYNIYFNPKWKELPGGPIVPITGTLEPEMGKMHVNGELITAHPDGVAGNWGMEWWQTGSTGYQYQLNFCGSHIMNYWRATNNDQTHGGVNIQYGYDQRFALGVRPYGLPAIKGTNNLWVISLKNWTEENVM